MDTEKPTGDPKSQGLEGSPNSLVGEQEYAHVFGRQNTPSPGAIAPGWEWGKNPSEPRLRKHDSLVLLFGFYTYRVNVARVKRMSLAVLDISQDRQVELLLYLEDRRQLIPAESTAPGAQIPPHKGMAAEAELHFNLPALLEQLSQEELREFKSRLELLVQQHELHNVPLDEMEEASVGNLVNILTNHCPGGWVEMVTMHVLQELNRKDLAEKAEEELTDIAINPGGILVLPHEILVYQEQEEDVDRKRTDPCRRIILKKFKRLWLNNFRQGEGTKFYLATEHYRRLFLLCDPLRRGHPEPQTLVLHGPPGSGKTTLVKKLILDWAEGHLGPAFHLAHYVSCQELHLRPVRNLQQLLFGDCPDMEDHLLTHLLDDKEALLVVDGFDELRCKAGDLIQGLSTQWEQNMPVPVLLASLLKRTVLPSVTLVVTTRPHALRELMLVVDHPVLLGVQGFSDAEKLEYFRRQFRDPAQARRALEAVKGNPVLRELSAAPEVCRALCACLRPLMRRGEDPALACRTSTDLFLQFFCDGFRPSSQAPVPLAGPLEALCRLATRMLRLQQSTFYAWDLRRERVEDSDLQPFRNLAIIQRSRGSRRAFRFTHLSFQQLLAALFYLLEPQPRPGQDAKDMRELLSKEAQEKNPDLAQAGLFLFGLLNQNRAWRLEAAFGCQMALETRRRELLERPPEGGKPFLLQTRLSQVFSWLYESQDEELVQEALAPLEEMSVALKSRQDLLQASFCLQHCPGLRRLTLQVAKGLFPEDGDQGHRCDDAPALLALWTDLCSMFSSNTNLKSLELSHSSLSSSSVAVLCEQLPTASNLQKVVLKNISPAGTQHSLCSCLSGSEALMDLTLQGPSQEDLLPLLCQILRHPKCSLKDLRLGYCSIASQLWEDFFLAVQASPLVGLELTDIEVLDRGAELLCQTLIQPGHTLQKLILENCQLTQACCKDLVSVLIVSQQLIYLSLACNDLGDVGVKMLCEGLSHPDCQLQTLVSLQQESRLTRLDLGLNPIGDSGMRALCQALKSPLCHLQCLWLWDCSITASSCGELAEALRGNQKLVTLDLGQNSLELKGLMMLYGALQSQRCSLQTLRLKINEANPEVKKLISTVQKVNPQLTVDSDHQDPRKRRAQDLPD
ncbi:NACHT, LRR and PYD domains-containing protein 2 [Thomomys bottae]